MLCRSPLSPFAMLLYIIYIYIYLFIYIYIYTYSDKGFSLITGDMAIS